MLTIIKRFWDILKINRYRRANAMFEEYNESISKLTEKFNYLRNCL